MSIVVLTGYKGSGKDTVANYLVHKYKYKQLAFADVLKKMASEIYSLDSSYFDDRKLKDSIVEKYNETPRTLLKKIANSVKTNISTSFFTDYVISQINPNENTVISDLRFPDEYKKLTEINSVFIRVKRPGVDDTDFIEKNIDNFECNYEVTNDSTIDNLYNSIDEIINDLNI